MTAVPDPSAMTARARLLYRILLVESDAIGLLDLSDCLQLSHALAGYGPHETAELQREGLIEPCEGGWIVTLKELLSR